MRKLLSSFRALANTFISFLKPRRRIYHQADKSQLPNRSDHGTITSQGNRIVCTLHGDITGQISPCSCWHRPSPDQGIDWGTHLYEHHTGKQVNDHPQHAPTPTTGTTPEQSKAPHRKETLTSSPLKHEIDPAVLDLDNANNMGNEVILVVTNHHTRPNPEDENYEHIACPVCALKQPVGSHLETTTCPGCRTTWQRMGNILHTTPSRDPDYDSQPDMNDTIPADLPTGPSFIRPYDIRIKAGFAASQLAAVLGVTTADLRTWEWDLQPPKPVLLASFFRLLDKEPEACRRVLLGTAANSLLLTKPCPDPDKIEKDSE